MRMRIILRIAMVRERLRDVVESLYAHAYIQRIMLVREEPRDA